MRWLFILLIAGLAILKAESRSFACGGGRCLFSTKAHAEEEKSSLKVGVKEVYQCSNCGYEQDKRGNCPMCNIELKKVKVARTYSCPSCDYSLAKAGKCPMCKSNLVQKDIHYECPMCKMGDIKPGKCPKCGMVLAEKATPIEKPKHH